MFRFEIVRHAFLDCARNGRLLLLQVFANPILFGLFALWLLIPVASSLHLLLNFIVAVALLAIVITLHAGTLNYYSDCQFGGTPFWSPFRRALRHLLPVAICVAVFCLLWLFVDKLASYQTAFPTYLRSTFPASLRRHVTLSSLESLFTAIIFFARWIFVPAILLPLIFQAADRGFRGFGKDGLFAWRNTALNLPYWLVLIVCPLIGVLGSAKIMALTPDFRTSTYRFELASLIVRLPIAYVLGLFPWLFVCSVVNRCGAVVRAESNVPGDSPA